ncbi:DEAD/DEAH box helicase [Haloglomus salinum]|uniref:DEAD/DEAH box helicase n=1 Tax=Haloglomus salinum TaxID=2962673 RepID=UPI0020CA2422|nr:DEAD/DEAH box helicase [Haloglomus salinum]
MTGDDPSAAATDALPLTGRELVETFPRYADLDEHVSVRELEPRAARTVPVDEVLRPELAANYPYDPFVHQARALAALDRGENVCVATSTSSGKTDVYALQIARNVLDARARDAESTAYVVYPMKALAQDQQRELSSLYDRLGLDIEVAVYDGDTELGETRRRIREEADVVISNFMGVNTYLHNHDVWSRFFNACDLVVVDESHTYTGVQGMHVAWILRRLKRVLDYYGSDPSFVCSSATIGNPGEHSEALLGEPVTVVDEDGSPRGRRDLVLWNPPPTERRADAGGEDTGGERDDGESFERQPASVEAPRVFSHLTYHDVRTLMFTPSRKLAELSVGRAREHRREHPRSYTASEPSPIEPYHAGQGKRKRHTTEQSLKSGALDGVAATSALELGINVGEIDATLLMGYPGQRQSFWQRVGRAGRDAADALSVLVADYATLDQYIVDNPVYLLEGDVEDAVVDTTNDRVFAQHLLCAADEVAIDETDAGEGPDDAFADRDRLERAVEMWRRAGKLTGHLETGVSYVGPPRPQTDVNLYATDDEQYQVRVTEDTPPEQEPDLEPLARERAFRDYHEGAVRVHGDQQYEVVDIEHGRDGGTSQPYVRLQPVDVDYYTRTRSEVTVLDAESEESREVNGFRLHFGTGSVLVHHAEYDRVRISDNERIGTPIPTELPPLTMDTQLCWVEVPEQVERGLVERYADYRVPDLPEEQQSPHLGYMGGLHAAEHGMIGAAPLELMLDPGDLGGLSTLLLDGHLAEAERAGSVDEGGATSADSDGDAPGSVEAVRTALEARQREGSLERSASGWFVYDGVEGGLGFSRAVYESFEALARRTRERIAACTCARTEGCPACVMDENCGNDNRPLHREAAVDVLDHLLGDADERALAPEETDERRPPLFYS